MVYSYVAIARLIRPVVTFLVTLVSIATMDVHRKEAGKPEETYILWPLLDATRAKIPSLHGKSVFVGLFGHSLARWWFQRFFIFTPTWGRFPF